MARRKKARKSAVKKAILDLAKYTSVGPLKKAIKRLSRGGKVRLSVKNAPFIYRNA